MKKLYIIFGLISITLTACPQQTRTFHETMIFEKGFILNGKIYNDIPTGVSSITWDLITGKPVSFLPAPHTHMWTDITNNPANLIPSLEQAIEVMSYLPLPIKTTSEIAKIVIPAGKAGVVFNKTDTALMIYYNGVWKHFILDQ